MRSANVYNKELSRHQLGGFIPVYDQIPGTHYFLLDGNRLGFMLSVVRRPVSLIISRMC
ncbi:putative transfer protein [Escherichia coli]|uniref:Putative transfer protein n=1 Tax=Escherichia coli TaxID=562 RepID=A0A377F4P9_ECOLX|nr:putative transfer protein [Escherichia coli]